LVTYADNVLAAAWDPVTLAPLGVSLEESRINLALQSNVLSSWTNINTTESVAPASPFAFESAWKIEETAATGFHDMQTTVSGGFTGGTAYSVSCYLAPAERTNCQVILLRGSDFCLVTVNLSTFTATSGGVSNFSAPSGITLTAAVNGYYLLNFTTTPTNTGTGIASVRVGTSSYAGTAGSGIYFAGMQVEASGACSSYISTTSAAAARAADVCEITGSNFSSWYNPNQGTFVVTCIPARGGGATAEAAFGLNDTGSTNRFTLNAARSGAAFAETSLSFDPVGTSIIASGPYAKGALMTAACSYSASGAAMAVNGLYIGAVAGTPPVFTKLVLGNDSGGRPLNGTLARLAYYPVALSTAQLQALSR
jgi:hypothetical protein